MFGDVLGKLCGKVLNIPFLISSAALGVGMSFSLTGSAQTVEWKEDVRLLDGTVITVKQKRLCRGGDYNAAREASCIASDAWVSMRLPKFATDEIVWHVGLKPMIINVYKDKLYIVGRPPTSVEFRKYGALNPPYYGFLWQGKMWQRIEFSEIPEEIYGSNMLIESIPKTRSDHIGLEQKKVETSGYTPHLYRIEPSYKVQAH